MEHHYLGIGASLTTALCWTATAVYFTNAGRRIGSPAVNGLRLLLASAFLAISVLVSNSALPWQVSFKSLVILSSSGVIGLALGDACLFQAFVVLGPRLATLIMSLWPSFAAILGWLLLGEKISLMGCIGMAITIVCVGWVATEKTKDSKQTVSKAGLFLAFIGAIGQSLGYVIAKPGMVVDQITKEVQITPLSATFIRLLAASFLVWSFAILKGSAKNWIKAASMDKKALLWICLGSFCGPFLGVWMSLVAARYTEIGVAATLMSTSPIWIIPISFILYGDKPSWRAILGAFGAVSGISILALLN